MASNAERALLFFRGNRERSTPAHGLRRSRYRGFAKVELQKLLIATVCHMGGGNFEDTNHVVLFGC
jgi:hypothetical protein